MFETNGTPNQKVTEKKKKGGEPKKKNRYSNRETGSVRREDVKHFRRGGKNSPGFSMLSPVPSFTSLGMTWDRTTPQTTNMSTGLIIGCVLGWGQIEGLVLSSETRLKGVFATQTVKRKLCYAGCTKLATASRVN